jgi:hypothetical protein
MFVKILCNNLYVKTVDIKILSLSPDEYSKQLQQQQQYGRGTLPLSMGWHRYCQSRRSHHDPYLLVTRNEEQDSEVQLDDTGDVRKDRTAVTNIKTAHNHNQDENGRPISPTSAMDATQSITKAHSDVSSLPSSIVMSKSQEEGNHHHHGNDEYGYNDLNLLPRQEDNNNNSSKSALPPRHYTPGELDQAIENGNWDAVAASAAAIVGQGVCQSVSSDSERGVV